MKLIHIIYLVILISFTQTLIESDLVKSLPGYSYRGRLYSGYLSVSSVKQYHYMLNFANEDADHKPLVAWFNGGPGCSSLDGWAMENGPMQMDANGEYQINEYSWNKAANMLYIESPGGVGFSYIDSKYDYELEINDDIAAEDNLKAVLDFFSKFPSFKGRDFYISGESYAGIYIPMLAYKIIMYNKQVIKSQQINLKGILVGNGVADWDYDATLAMYDFAFTHHLASYENRMEYNKYCLIDYDKEQCDRVLNTIEQWLDNINIYDYLQRCELPTTKEGYTDYFSSYFLKSPWAFRNLKQKQEELKMKLKTKAKEPEKKLKLSPSCVDDTPLLNYFNREDVKTALHVNSDIYWELCSGEVSERYNIQEKGSIWAYPTIIESGVRVLIYSGDTDMAVPFSGNQAWIHNLKLEEEKKWTQWRAFDDMDNVAGYYVKYKGLTFCTVKGTGHMVPQWKPKEAYYMFTKFLNDEDF